MGLFDKIKDLFTDEEEIIEDDKDDAVKIKEIKKEEHPKVEKLEDTSENKLPTFMREKIEQEEKEKFKIDKEQDVKPDFNVSSRVSARINNNVYTEDTVEIPKKDENSFKFPVEFDDSDFVPTRSKKPTSVNYMQSDSKQTLKEVKKEEPVKKEKKVADLYKGKTKEEEHKFKATPIISPIYGVLDKNYSKDQIKEADEDSYEIKRSSSTKNVDFDSVRKKAFGSLTDDIKDNLMCENCELLKEAKEEKRKKETQDNLIYDMLKEEDEVSSKDITFGDATENYYDYGVAYEAPSVPKRSKEELDYEDVKEEESVKIVNSEEVEDKPVKKEIPPVKSSINLLSTLKKSMGDNQVSKEEKTDDKKDLELTDDLFNLIDSMYDERND
jgi:hypothetical protein